jgi:hypothetical protein
MGSVFSIFRIINEDEGDICQRYHGGNEESYEAHAGTDKQRSYGMILGYLRERWGEGGTCDEIEIATGMPHQTASARCSELVRDGVVVRRVGEDGKRIRRETRHECMASVLFLREAVPGVVVEYDEEGQGYFA